VEKPIRRPASQITARSLSSPFGKAVFGLEKQLVPLFKEKRLMNNILRKVSNGRAIMVGLIVCLAATIPAFAVSYIETTDFPGGVNPFNPSIGTLDPGANSVVGTLNGNCNIGDCNPPSGGDTQDSFRLTVPAGFQITSLTVTTSAVSGPTNLSVSMQLSGSSGTVKFEPFLTPLPGTTANLLSAPVGAGTYDLSIFGQQATAAGAYSLNWSVAMTLASVSITPTQAVTNLTNLVSNPSLGLAVGQVNSLTDKLNNVLASIQAGENKQAINQLNAFINSVESSVKNGKITGATGTVLIDAANAIIALLS
jgi:hypothetical protein